MVIQSTRIESVLDSGKIDENRMLFDKKSSWFNKFSRSDESRQLCARE
jgi:hypothetical protein